MSLGARNATGVTAIEYPGWIFVSKKQSQPAHILPIPFHTLDLSIRRSILAMTPSAFAHASVAVLLRSTSHLFFLVRRQNHIRPVSIRIRSPFFPTNATFAVYRIGPVLKILLRVPRNQQVRSAPRVFLPVACSRCEPSQDSLSHPRVTSGNAKNCAHSEQISV